MVNYACAFSQSELGKYFERIIILFNPYLRKEQSNLISYKDNRTFIQKLRWELSICDNKPLNSVAYVDFYRGSLVLLDCLTVAIGPITTDTKGKRANARENGLTAMLGRSNVR